MQCNGHVIAGTTLAVDWWLSANTKAVTHYFCSHAHSDHTAGLDSSWTKPIYCSPITAKLLTLFRNVPPSLLIPITEPLILPYNDETITVTPYHANHCAGALMFMFEGSFGNILYTGDFRYSPQMCLPLSGLKFDMVYFDNTYGANTTVEFITREQCKKEATALVAECINNDGVLFFCMDKLGKEDILEYVAAHFSYQIVISKSKMETMSIISDPELYTTSQSDGRLYFVNRHKLNKKSIEKIRAFHSDKRVTFVQLTGYRHGDIQDEFRYIPYSEHSTSSEIDTFFKSFSFKSAIPIVSRLNENVKLKQYRAQCKEQVLMKAKKVATGVKFEDEEEISVEETFHPATESLYPADEDTLHPRNEIESESVSNTEELVDSEIIYPDTNEELDDAEQACLSETSLPSPLSQQRTCPDLTIGDLVIADTTVTENKEGTNDVSAVSKTGIKEESVVDSVPAELSHLYSSLLSLDIQHSDEQLATTGARSLFDTLLPETSPVVKRRPARPSKKRRKAKSKRAEYLVQASKSDPAVDSSLNQIATQDTSIPLELAPVRRRGSRAKKTEQEIADQENLCKSFFSRQFGNNDTADLPQQRSSRSSTPILSEVASVGEGLTTPPEEGLTTPPDEALSFSDIIDLTTPPQDKVVKQEDEVAVKQDEVMIQKEITAHSTDETLKPAQVTCSADNTTLFISEILPDTAKLVIKRRAGRPKRFLESLDNGVPEVLKSTVKKTERGRPKKVPECVENDVTEVLNVLEKMETVVKKKRGRPKKVLQGKENKELTAPKVRKRRQRKAAVVDFDGCSKTQWLTPETHINQHLAESSMLSCSTYEEAQSPDRFNPPLQPDPQLILHTTEVNNELLVTDLEDNKPISEVKSWAEEIAKIVSKPYSHSPGRDKGCPIIIDCEEDIPTTPQIPVQELSKSDIDIPELAIPAQVISSNVTPDNIIPDNVIESTFLSINHDTVISENELSHFPSPIYNQDGASFALQNYISQDTPLFDSSSDAPPSPVIDLPDEGDDIPDYSSQSSIEVLMNNSQDSVATLHVSETDCDSQEEDLDIGSSLRDHYTSNIAFNKSILEFDKSFRKCKMFFSRANLLKKNLIQDDEVECKEFNLVFPFKNEQVPGAPVVQPKLFFSSENYIDNTRINELLQANEDANAARRKKKALPYITLSPSLTQPDPHLLDKIKRKVQMWSSFDKSSSKVTSSSKKRKSEPPSARNINNEELLKRKSDKAPSRRNVEEMLKNVDQKLAAVSVDHLKFGPQRSNKITHQRQISDKVIPQKQSPSVALPPVIYTPAQYRLDDIKNKAVNNWINTSPTLQKMKNSPRQSSSKDRRFEPSTPIRGKRPSSPNKKRTKKPKTSAEDDKKKSAQDLFF